MIWRALAIVLALALPGAARQMPQPLSPHVSDFAGVLDEAAEARLTAHLQALRADPGVEVAVVTVARLADHGGAALEPFATALFNAWGIGDAQANDGVLLLLAVQDRAARIELGAGYPPVWDNRALRVMDALMVPRFADGDYPAGLEAGLQGLEEYILRPFKSGAAVSGTEDMPDLPGGGIGADLLIFLAFVAGIFGWQGWRARHRIGDMAAVFRPCPTCSGRGVVVERETVSEPGETTPGMVRVTRRCPTCGWHHDRSDPLPSLSAQKDSGSGGGFGGGRSSGGGASGRW
jgi:uncharacterized protein